MYRWFLIVAVFLAAVAGLLIGVLNPDPIVLRLALFEPSLPLGALVLLIFALGVLVGMLLFWLLFALPAQLRRQPRSDDHRGVKLRSLNE